MYTINIAFLTYPSNGKNIMVKQMANGIYCKKAKIYIFTKFMLDEATFEDSL